MAGDDGPAKRGGNNGALKDGLLPKPKGGRQGLGAAGEGLSVV